MRAEPRAVHALPSRSDKLDCKFTSRSRLLRRDGFGETLKGSSLSGAAFKAFVLPNRLEHARLGIIVSKRDFPLAHQRNRIKRIVRETFRCHRVKTRRLDLVLMARRRAIPSAADLEVLLNRIDTTCATF